MKYFFSLVIFSLLFLGCEHQHVPEITRVNGVKPIYSSVDEWQDIKIAAPRNISKLGKIYYKDEIIFVNENSEGIHIINNADPTNPIFLKFIQIYGTKDIAIKGNILYADNVTDLVTFDISDLDNILILDRVKNVYPNAGQVFPEDYTGAFECIDSNLGIVIGWKNTVLVDPECWR